MLVTVISCIDCKQPVKLKQSPDNKIPKSLTHKCPSCGKLCGYKLVKDIASMGEYTFE